MRIYNDIVFTYSNNKSTHWLYLTYFYEKWSMNNAQQMFGKS